MSRGLVCLVLSMCVSSTAWAQPTPEGLEVTFGAGALEPYARPRMMVVAAGEGADLAAAERAAQMMRQSLRVLERTTLVMDGAALGEVAHLPDADLARRAAGQPVDVVVIVRAYPAGQGHTYVLGFFLPAGSKLYSVVGLPGEPLPPKRAATVAVRPGPADEFWIVERPNDEIVGYVKGSRRKHKGAALYTRLGRPDLAREYQRRERQRTYLTIPTFLLGGASIVVGSLALFGILDEPCVGNQCPDGWAPVGVGLVAGGAALWGLTAFFANANLHPLTFEELRELARQRAKLQATLGPRGLGVRASF